VRGTERRGCGKKGGGARWLLCARTEGGNGGEGAQARRVAKREGRGPVRRPLARGVWRPARRATSGGGRRAARCASRGGGSPMRGPCLESVGRSGKKGNGPGLGRIVPSSIYLNISKKT
jgi:hypothetical protein